MKLEIPEQAIKELQTLYREKYKIILSDEKAEEEALILLNLYALAQGKNIFD